MENESLATELIRELRAQSKRWFITALVELGIIIAIVFAFIWYLTLPIDEITIDSGEGGNANYIGRDVEGGLYNGENHTKEESSSEQRGN